METTAETTTRVYERELRIAARPETVWEFLVDPEKASRWMGTTVALDPRPGGSYRVEVIPGNVARGEFLEVDPPRRLVQTWGWEAGESSAVAAGSTTIEISLEPSDGGTVLRFRHLGLPSDEALGSHTHGWDHYLPRLELAAGGKDPGADPWLTRVA